MNVEDQMYETQRLKMRTWTAVALVFIFVSGILGFTFLNLNRPIPAPLVTTEGCVKMCGELGVENYTELGCACKKPVRPVIGNMLCECRERTEEEKQKLNHY